MNRSDYLRKVLYLLELCEHECSGPRRDLAERFEVSESTIKRMIQDLRDCGFRLSYDKGKDSYVILERELVE